MSKYLIDSNTMESIASTVKTLTGSNEPISGASLASTLSSAAAQMPEEYCIGGSLVGKTLTGYHFGNMNSGSLFTNMFYNCADLEIIENISSAITTIPNYFASNCQKLQTINLPNTITAIGQFAFNSCSLLSLKKLPDNLELLFKSAFIDCSNIEIEEIPSGVTVIPQTCFRNCTSITSLKFLGDITSIELNALQSLTSCLIYDFTHNTQVPTLGSSNTFGTINPNAKIVVPDNLISSWKETTNWVAYMDYIINETNYLAL